MPCRLECCMAFFFTKELGLWFCFFRFIGSVCRICLQGIQFVLQEVVVTLLHQGIGLADFFSNMAAFAHYAQTGENLGGFIEALFKTATNGVNKITHQLFEVLVGMLAGVAFKKSGGLRQDALGGGFGAVVL